MTDSGMAAVDGGELYYESAGEGRPVVLSHAGFLTHRMWDEQFALLARTHRVVRFDARGHGRSSVVTEEYRPYEDLRQLLDFLRIDRVTIVGNSLGGRTGVDFALTCPERTAALVTVAGGASGMDIHDPAIVALNQRLATVTTVEDGLEIFLRMWVDGPRRTPDQVDPAVRELCRRLAAETASRHNIMATFQSMREVRAIDRLEEVAVPVLAMVGDLDATDIEDIAERLGKRGRKVLIPGAGHMISLEQPEIFNRTLLDFLAGQESRSRRNSG
ncbi:alpha/beta fold hydrolase [Fodinicola acaciae]|uniref:alpha/beta fold hydrolase n=1 Tax=Fodinicola acaciae TaxID=2681555 RepID=UPI0013D60E5D|nr:alpha/beta hydrolase [Fodinicola acaciae]